MQCVTEAAVATTPPGNRLLDREEAQVTFA
jgi:hypothetical protein